MLGRILKRVVVPAMAATVLAAIAHPAAAQPSWCKYARSDAERTICATPELWALDSCEDGLFQQAKSSGTAAEKRAVDAAERQWIEQRDACGSDAACIGERYRERARVLDPSGRSSCAAVAATVPPQQPAPPQAAAPPAPHRCATAEAVQRLLGTVQVTSRSARTIEHGARIEIDWSFSPADAAGPRMYLIGAMADGVRFEGRYRFDEYELLEAGPGFIALPGTARAPYGIRFGAGRTRVIIPMHDPDTHSSGRLWVKPYVAGKLDIDWSLVAVTPGCADGEIVQPVTQLGPYEVIAGAPTIVVQDFISADPSSATDASGAAALRLREVEISKDGRYRLEILERRYRVIDRSSEAKIVDRSGVQPRFSPTGRFVLASVGDTEKRYPTNFELIDLLAGKMVDHLDGPIVGWTNGDALVLDGGRAYQNVGLVRTLIDPFLGAEGYAKNHQGFFPGCGTCDAWTGSNIHIDWDTLVALRGDSDDPATKNAVGMASGRSVGAEDGLKGDTLAPYLTRLYGRPQVALEIGWGSDQGLILTHVGRGYDGYVGPEGEDAESLQPAQAGRPNQKQFLAQRRVALADGRILIAEDLRPVGGLRGTPRAAWSIPGSARSVRLDAGYVAKQLADFGLPLQPTRALSEIEIPQTDQWNQVVRAWPKDLQKEVVGADPSMKPWFQEGEGSATVIVGGWRFKHGGTSYLLIQHGEAAMTANGAHSLQFDLLATEGRLRGAKLQLKELGGGYSQFVGRDHTVARVFMTHDERLIVAIPGSGKAAVVSLARPTAVHTIDMVEPTLLCGFYASSQRRLVVQSNCDGQFFAFNPAAGPGALVSGRIVDDEIIVYNAQGYYAATYEGAHFVHLAFPGLAGVHSFEQFARTLDRPDVIRAAIAGTRVRFPAPNLLPPPQLALSLEATAGSELAIGVRAKSDSGLVALELYADGRRFARQALSAGTFEEAIRVPRHPHVRSITGVAIDSDGFRSRPYTLELPASAGRSNTLHVLAVGVDAYAKLAPLKFARFDAETLVRSMQRSAVPYYANIRTQLLVDADVAPDRVLADLRNMVAAAGEADTILVFFAGHGGRTKDGKYYLMGAASDPERLQETAIDWEQMAKALGGAKARVIFVIDACHAGQTGQIKTTNDDAVASITGGAPMVVLAGSKGRQSSEELATVGGGVFTQSLAQLLTKGRAQVDTNHNGSLEVSEIYRSLKQAVVRATAGRQTPWLVRRNFVGDAPLF